MSARVVNLPGLRVTVEAEADLFGMCPAVRDWAESVVQLLETGDLLNARLSLDAYVTERDPSEAARAAYYDSHRAEVEAWPEVPAPSSEEAKEEPLLTVEPGTAGQADGPLVYCVGCTGLFPGEVAHNDPLTGRACGMVWENPADSMPADTPAEPPQSRLDCPTCGKTFTRPQSRATHERSHMKRACSKCGAMRGLPGLAVHEATCPGNLEPKPTAADAVAGDLAEAAQARALRDAAAAAMPAVGAVIVTAPDADVNGGCLECGKWPTRPGSPLCEKHYQIADVYRVRDAVGVGAG